MTNRVLIKLSAMVDAMNLDLSLLKSKDKEEMGFKLLGSILRGLHKCEAQYLELVAEYKGCTLEEAAQADAVETIKAIMTDGNVADFFSST